MLFFVEEPAGDASETTEDSAAFLRASVLTLLFFPVTFRLDAFGFQLGFLNRLDGLNGRCWHWFFLLPTNRTDTALSALQQQAEGRHVAWVTDLVAGVVHESFADGRIAYLLQFERIADELLQVLQRCATSAQVSSWSEVAHR